MPSDLPHARLRSRGGTPTGSPDPLARLAAILAEASGGVRPTPLELAEVLWLARQLEPVDEERRTSSQEPAPSVPPGPSATPGPDVPPEQPQTPQEDPPTVRPAPDPAPAVPRESSRAPLHLPSPAPSAPGTHASLLAPAPPMLRHPLGLQRALRPLKRRTDAPTGHRLDEPATADRIARLGAAPEWWLPVLRPARERWLRLHLVYDTGPTMPVWRPLVHELHTALAQSGIFRTVIPARVAPDGTVHGHGAHAPGDGRTVTLVISDCMGPQWRPGEAGRRWNGTLHRWTRQMPVAVVQPLPEHLWRDTALPTASGLLSAPYPAAPTAALTFAPYDAYDDEPADGVPLPVLEPDPRWLANWAGLLTSAGGTAHPGSAALLGRPLDPETRTDVSRLSPEELVLRFRATSSPEAFRLAGHLALGRPDLPVMRLVQRAVEADPRPQHLAEVILGGLLTSVSGPPGSYAFRPGVRDLLLRSLPRSSRGRTTELLARLGGLIEERAGAAPGEFPAVTPAPGGTGRAEADGEPFATVRPESVRRLTGQAAAPAGLFGGYRLVRRLAPGGSVWLAESVADRGRVALRLLEPVTEPARREAFVRDAARLQELAHPDVVAVRGYGFEGDVPYVAMEYVDGIPLRALAALNAYLLPMPLVVSVGSRLAHAVTALHRAGVTHGGLGMSRIVLLPDGTARLGVFEPGRASGPDGRAKDLRALCEVMLRLTAGTSRLTLPIGPDELGRLPQALRITYAHAFNLLMSPSLKDQERGSALLMHEELPLGARETYDQRFYYVLGPLHVELPDSAPEFSPLERAALALLLLRNGRTVTLDQFRAGLWDRGEEPEDALAVLARVTSRLRHALGPGTLATLPDGYALHTSADYVDLVHREELERTATVLAERGSPLEAREHLETALGLFRSGPSFADVPGPAARTARTNLAQLRLDLYRKRSELDLDIGEYERAAADLGDLLRAHPDREDYRRLLLIALRHLGRVEEALEVYQEYEWSGGEDPDLLALGHELRGEYYDDHEDAGAPEYDPGADYTAVSAPDELPEEGLYPTEGPSLLYGPDDPAEERPLPRDEVPESLFTAEDGTDDHPAPAPRLVAVFECAGGPGNADDRATLGRAVARLLVASGLDPGRYDLEARENGWSVRLERGVPELPLLAVTLREFTDRVAETGGIRWLVTFPGEDGEAWHPPGELVDRLRDVNGARGIVCVSDALRNRLVGSGHAVPGLRSTAFRHPDDVWYRLAYPPSADTVHPVQGPFRLPEGVPLPEPAGSTRAVVYTAYGTGLTLARPPGATFSYEVDLTERRLVLDEAGPPVDELPVLDAKGTAVWRITEPVDGVLAHARQLASDHIAQHLADCLREVAYVYPARGLALSRAMLEARLPALSLPGHEIRWAVDLALVHPSQATWPLWQADPALVDALREADAVLFGFAGTLIRPDIDTVEGAALDAQPLPHSDLLLRILADKGLPLAVVTDCSTAAALTYLDTYGLGDSLPGGVHGSGGLGPPMPDPHLLLRAARRLGVPPRDCLMIGTTVPERDAALAAGIGFVHVDSSLGLLALLRAARTL
ncbi:SAV_2336 N-terminal domain-related protein [Streptomyces sp. NPDC005728]|uniref:SAV_2336 N-terminal domain-related protein n=1 Tax=Streptomyces sp. NPDC005728 TaxID=3157054 RepID=UPI0033D02257